MLKISCLMFLVAVAVVVPWLHVDAQFRLKETTIQRFGKRAIMSDETTIQRFGKRAIMSDETGQLSAETQESLTKDLLAVLLLMSVDSDHSAEKEKLALEFQKAVDKQWDSLDDFTNHLYKTYENIIGVKPEMGRKRK